jgi:signal recognition particle receptor subunit alpha
MQETITKILTPKKQIDLLLEAKKAKNRGKTYIITFIGVNGVGKSTTLSKVAHLLKS